MSVSISFSLPFGSDTVASVGTLAPSVGELEIRFATVDGNAEPVKRADILAALAAVYKRLKTEPHIAAGFGQVIQFPVSHER